MKNAIQKSLESTPALVTPQSLCAGYSAQKQNGFTLIELLVVVLIIGILAAVALPQYQKAVLKSRFTQIESDMRSLAQAAEVCAMAKGSRCSKDELDIDVSDCKPIPGLSDIDTACYYDVNAYSDRIYLYGKYGHTVAMIYYNNPPAGFRTGVLYGAYSYLAPVGFTKFVGTDSYKLYSRE